MRRFRVSQWNVKDAYIDQNNNKIIIINIVVEESSPIQVLWRLHPLSTIHAEAATAAAHECVGEEWANKSRQIWCDKERGAWTAHIHTPNWRPSFFFVLCLFRMWRRRRRPLKTPKSYFCSTFGHITRHVWNVADTTDTRARKRLYKGKCINTYILRVDWLGDTHLWP